MGPWQGLGASARPSLTATAVQPLPQTNPGSSPGRMASSPVPEGAGPRAPVQLQQRRGTFSSPHPPTPQLYCTCAHTHIQTLAHTRICLKVRDPWKPEAGTWHFAFLTKIKLVSIAHKHKPRKRASRHRPPTETPRPEAARSRTFAAAPPALRLRIVLGTPPRLRTVLGGARAPAHCPGDARPPAAGRPRP